MNRQPPRWAERFLEWYCNPELLEDIQGDAHELYFKQIHKGSKRKADLQFVWNVLRYFRWSNMKRNRKYSSHSSTSAAMFKSYFISGIRSMLRNIVPSSINIAGMSVALGCAITIFILIDSFYNLDTMHKKGDRIYLVMDQVKGGDETESWSSSPYLLGPALQSDHPGVESVVRIERHRGVSVRKDDKVFSENVWFVDPEFLNMFSFGIQSGDPRALRDKNNIVITVGMAEKYFGEEDPIGKMVSIKFNETLKEVFTVAAVAERISDNSSMSFGFLLPMAKWEDLKIKDLETWKTFTSSTFVLMKEGHSPHELSALLAKYKKIQNAANERWKIRDFEMIPLFDVAERSWSIVDSLSWSNFPGAMVGQAVIAIFLVLLACFNYMNVSVASVSTRLKEIGIRKVIGGGKKEIIQQFLTENLVMCTLALLVGCAISAFVLVPGFNTLFPIKVHFSFSSNETFFFFFGGILLFVALVSGAYPALYVASFNPVKILRGKEKFGSKSVFSKILLSMQFVLAFTTIVGCFVFVAAGDYFEDKDWGYDQSQTVVVQIQNKEQYLGLKDELLRQKSVVGLAGAEGHVGHSGLVVPLKAGEQNVNVQEFGVGFDYLEVMGIRLKAGRFFDKRLQSDKMESVVINELFAKKMGWVDPVSQTFEYDSVKRYVVGVVEDFYANDFFSRIEPTLFHIVPEEKFRYVVTRAVPGSAGEVKDITLETWKKIAPDDPYKGFYQSESFDQFYNSNHGNNKVLYVIAGAAVFLSCMGLYGLVSYNLTRRLKEFSVRKVFGANLFQIFRLMNGDYIWIVLIAFLIGAPAGFYLIETIIRSAYPETIPTRVWPFGSTILLMLVTVAVTISTQLSRIAKENPTTTLRSE
jgi:ABC-type antimicrobial peptide transport system permease subunit